jgi:hypothetical protein
MNSDSIAFEIVPSGCNPEGSAVLGADIEIALFVQGSLMGYNPETKQKAPPGCNPGGTKGRLT